MSQVQLKLKGWSVALAAIVLACLGGIRYLTFQDKTNDTNLMRDLEVQIKSDYMPKEVARLQASLTSGDRNKISEVTESVTSAKPKIESVQASSPLLDFSSQRDVVVKVVYSLVEGTNARDTKTLYFLYKHGAIGNTWSCQHKTTAIQYYLNFK